MHIVVEVRTGYFSESGSDADQRTVYLVCQFNGTNVPYSVLARCADGIEAQAIINALNGA